MEKIMSRLWFSVIAGIAYLFFGVMQIFSGLWLLPIKTGLFPGDIMGGFVLIIVSFVFFFGVWELKTGIDGGVSYVYVGMVLSLILAAVYLLIMIGSLLSAAWVVLENGDFEWDLFSNLRPIIFLALLSLFAFLSWRKDFGKPLSIEK